MTENNEHLALWGGRFTSGPSPELARLSKSTQFDWRLADDDIAGSRAHARALGRAGLLTADELQRMEDALDTLQRHVDDGSFAPIEDDEDEATALERGLIDIAGDDDYDQDTDSVLEWMNSNAYKYGFILRYPSGKESVTGAEAENDHYRYVGKEAAKVIHDQGICLEEYLSQNN